MPKIIRFSNNFIFIYYYVLCLHFLYFMIYLCLLFYIYDEFYVCFVFYVVYVHVIMLFYVFNLITYVFDVSRYVTLCLTHILHIFNVPETLLSFFMCRVYCQGSFMSSDNIIVLFEAESRFCC